MQLRRSLRLDDCFISLSISSVAAPTHRRQQRNRSSPALGAAAAPNTYQGTNQESRIVALLLLVFTVVIFFWMVFHQNGMTLTKFAEVFTATESTGWTRIAFNVWALAVVVVLVYALFNLFQAESTRSRIISAIVAVGAGVGIYFFYNNTPTS